MEETEHVLAVNFHGLLAVITAVLPYLRRQRSGHIINVSSVAGLAPMAGSGLYTAAKCALEGAADGIGPSTVDLSTAHGVRVVAEDIVPAVGELAKAGEVVTLVGYAAEEPTAVRIVKLALESFGRLDVPVNKAGKTLNKPLLETSLFDWNSITTNNARGYFLHAREAVRVMFPTGGGRGDCECSLQRGHEGDHRVYLLQRYHRAVDQGDRARVLRARYPCQRDRRWRDRNRPPRGHRRGQPGDTCQLRTPACAWSRGPTGRDCTNGGLARFAAFQLCNRNAFDG